MGREALYTVTGPRLIVEMTSPEVRELINLTTTVVMSVGSIEQHGPHLPLFTDYYQADDLIRRTVLALEGRGILVAGGFVLPLGPAEDGMAFAGTVSIRTETFLMTLNDVLESLYRHGFRYIPIILHHEQNMGPCMAAVREFNARHVDAVAGVLAGWFQAGVVAQRHEIGRGSRSSEDGHAGEFETSRMLATRPELVQLNKSGVHYPPSRRRIPHDEYPLAGGGLYRPLHDYASVAPDGYIGAASLATPEVGEQMYSRAVDWICDVIQRDFVAAPKQPSGQREPLETKRHS